MQKAQARSVIEPYENHPEGFHYLGRSYAGQVSEEKQTPVSHMTYTKISLLLKIYNLFFSVSNYWYIPWKGLLRTPVEAICNAKYSWNSSRPCYSSRSNLKTHTYNIASWWPYVWDRSVKTLLMQMTSECTLALDCSDARTSIIQDPAYCSFCEWQWILLRQGGW